MRNKNFAKRKNPVQSNILNLEGQITRLLNDERVQKDRIFVLAEIYLMMLYDQGFSKDEIDIMQVMNPVFFMELIASYDEDLAYKIKKNPESVKYSYRLFFDGFKSMVRSMYLVSLRVGIDEVIDTLKAKMNYE